MLCVKPVNAVKTKDCLISMLLFGATVAQSWGTLSRELEGW